MKIVCMSLSRVHPPLVFRESWKRRFLRVLMRWFCEEI